ncbi:Hypothetical protein CINCED_3A014076 [Cinara cedri]|uniref:Uncharacterized protein n=1 Tax=Cinara cedri TaxID=506608 RepID=A0A5E4M6U3_9HEMI|nr:Hypothetical protein CINCED_3A014076 [Cinara cedri]
MTAKHIIVLWITHHYIVPPREDIECLKTKYGGQYAWTNYSYDNEKETWTLDKDLQADDDGDGIGHLQLCE